MLISANFEQIFRLHYEPLFHYALDWVADGEEARDLVSELFADVWHRREAIAEDEVRWYLYRALRNKCINHLRHKKVVQTAMVSLKLLQDIIDPDPDLHEERLARVLTAVDALPETTQRVFRRCYIDGKKYREVAEEMGISVDTVHKHVSKALKQLRRLKRQETDPPAVRHSGLLTLFAFFM